MWSRLADRILDHPRLILVGILSITVFLTYWAFQVKTDHTAGQFISAESKEYIDFQRASQVFGESQTLLYVVFEGADPYDIDFLRKVDSLTEKISAYRGVENVLSLTNVPHLVREGKSVVSRPLYSEALTPEEITNRLRSQPFLRELILSEDGSTTGLLVKIEEEFNDSPERMDLVNQIAQDAESLPGEIALAGFPYLRTAYASRIMAETPRFTILALLISLLFLFLTFRAWRAVLLPMLIVVLGIVWTIGLIALFDHRLNIVTAILPVLIVVIGMATTIHLSTQFFDHYSAGGDLRESLKHMIQAVGLATFLTTLTTAIGFAVLILSRSRLLIVFGEFAAAGIMLLYGLAITIIPITYSKLHPPTVEMASLATHDGFTIFFDRLSRFIKHHAKAILAGAVLITLTGLVGTSRISSDIFVFSDFYEHDTLRKDLAVFEKRFGGVLPMEIIIEAHKPGQFRSLGNLRRIEKLQTELEALEPVGRVLTATDLVKYANQAYLGGNPATYRLPSSYELPFLQSALGNLLEQNKESGLAQNIPSIMDSTFSTTRVFLGVRDIGTSRMNALADTARARAAALFPSDQFNVYTTGSAITSTRSGENLVKNLIGSLAVALLIISAIMAALFRSVRLTTISLIPNVIPLLLVGAVMGFAGITLKPSTALIFSLAFGIAVDDSIHFLTKYRMLLRTGLGKDEAIRVTLRSTGKAILFTSLVLMSGFLVFTLSNFLGTVNMGALTAFTLGASLVSNVLLLPTLLYLLAPEHHPHFHPSPAMTGNGVARSVTEDQRV